MGARSVLSRTGGRILFSYKTFFHTPGVEPIHLHHSPLCHGLSSMLFCVYVTSSNEVKNYDEKYDFHHINIMSGLRCGIMEIKAAPFLTLISQLLAKIADWYQSICFFSRLCGHEHQDHFILQSLVFRSLSRS